MDTLPPLPRCHPGGDAMTWELVGVIVLFVVGVGGLVAIVQALDDRGWRRYMQRAMRGETPRRRGR